MSLAEWSVILVVAAVLLGPKQWQQWVKWIGLAWIQLRKFTYYRAALATRLDQYADLANNEQRAHDSEASNDE